LSFTTGSQISQQGLNLSLDSIFNVILFQGLAPLDFYFKDIEKLCDDKSLSSRVRFMLQDLVDLRRSGWKPRRDVAGPKTIDQVRGTNESKIQCLINIKTMLGQKVNITINVCKVLLIKCFNGEMSLVH